MCNYMQTKIQNNIIAVTFRSVMITPFTLALVAMKFSRTLIKQELLGEVEEKIRGDNWMYFF